MKKFCILVLMLSWVVMDVTAQHIIYANLKDYLANEGDTVAALKVEKRTTNHLLMTGGADYKISASTDDPALCRYLKKRCYAVRIDSSLYVNCKRLRYNKFRFGGWYAPALQVNDKIYFSAVPLGSVVAGSDATMDVMLGGKFGDAIAASALIFKRVYYEIDCQSNKVDFVGKDKMKALLADHPEWLKEYTDENSESAKVTGKYLQRLKTVER